MTAKKKPAKPKSITKDVPFAVPDWPANRPQLRPLTWIKPYPNNPRTHPPAQIAFLASILQRRGVDQPIVVDETGVILKGHGRRLAAIAAGFEEFPVVIHRGLPEEEKTAMRIEDNQVSLLAGWDQELIRVEIGSLKAVGYNVDLLGFGEAQLVQFMTTPAPPGDFPRFDENIATEFCCPRCSYSWSGSPSGGRVKGDGGGTNDSLRLQMRGKANPKGRSRKTAKVSTVSSLAGSTKA